MSGYLIFGGIDSRDYDVFVSFSDIDTVPRRVYTKVDIVGKNGSVLIDEGKYEDVPHSYDCIVLDNEKRVAFVNAIMSKRGYQRLTDSYGTDEYYTAVLEENIEQKTTRIRDKYKFKLVFTRKPQRFLTSGEEPVDTSELGGEVTTDKIPYLFRRSGGGNIGHDFDAEIDKIIGGTVAWNQLVQNGNFADTSEWLVESSVNFTTSNNIATVTASVSANGIYTIFPVIAQHKYLITAQYKGGGIFFRSATIGFNDFAASTNWAIYNKIVNAETSSQSVDFRLRVGAVETDNTAYFKNIQLIDLTALFGSAEIADYVYSLEQTTAGAGIAWLKAHFPKMFDTYHAYNEGSLLSVKTSEHRTVGFNQWDEEWENGYYNRTNGVKAGNSDTTYVRSKNFIPCFSSTNYYYLYPKKHAQNNTYFAVLYYDADKNYIGNIVASRYTPIQTTPSNARYVTFYCEIGTSGATYQHDICINISKTTGSPKNGDYVAYDGHSYSLDPNLELRGLFKLDANNNLYADGDVYESSGAVTREYGIRAYQSGDESLADAITDGTNTVYKLTTPTTEQADPYANPQIVNSLGTEEYIDTRDVPVPVGHETKYGMSQLILSNPTEFPSKPLLEVTGAGTFWLGDTLFTITGTAGQIIYIDCETGECYKENGGIISSANGLVTLNRLDFPELASGITNIQLGSGISKVKITPRWWRL